MNDATPSTPQRASFSELSNFFPKQKLALQASQTYKYTFFGGTKGSGKSRWLRWSTAYHLMRWYQTLGLKNVVGAIFSEDYPTLKDRQISKIGTEFPPWLGTLHGDHPLYGRSYILAPEYGSGVIAFRNLDDPSKYESAEFALVALEEAQMDPLPVFEMLRTRMRWPGLEDTKMLLAGIPGGEAWVRQYFVDRNFSPTEAEAMGFFFIQALPGDNPHLPEAYLNALRSLPEPYRSAYLDGRWDVFDTVMDRDGWMRIWNTQEINNMQVEFGMHAGLNVLGIDPGAGGDNTSATHRSSVMAEVLFDQPLADTMAIIPLIAQWDAQHHYDLIAIDVVGVGRGLYDRLVELGYGPRLIPVNFGESPSTKAQDQKILLGTTYKNRKAELFDYADKWTKHGGKLKKHEAWDRELPVMKKKEDSERTMEIIDKKTLRKQGMKSPNVVDSFVLTFAGDDEKMKIQKQAQHQQYLDDFFGNDVQGSQEFGFIK